MEKVLEHERLLLNTAVSSSSLPEGGVAGGGVTLGGREVEGINLQALRDQVRS